MRLSLADIARVLDLPDAVSGSGAQFVPTGASTDNRTVMPGHLFFCLPGERVDGHNFASAAVNAGAIAVIGTRNPFDGASSVPLFLVPDTVAAMGRIARAHRDTMEGIVVGITGTSGKTSVKEALFAVLSQAGKTEKNPLNLNNQIGLPLSMLNASESAAYWVMEAGISQPHDMDELGPVLHPDLALILNAGAGHTEFLGDRGVAHYKARLLDHLAEGGRALVSADYPDLMAEAKQRAVPLVTFSGAGNAADYTATPVAALPGTSGAAGLEGAADSMAGRGLFAVRHAGGDVRVDAPFQGLIGSENTAAVAAAACCLGLDAACLVTGLAIAQPPVMRARVEECGPFVLIDDSYNANPLSMNRMLDNAAALAREKELPLVLALGEMGELGEESDRHHTELGGHVARLAPALLFWKGGRLDAFTRGVQDGGYPGGVHAVTGPEEFIRTMRESGITAAVVFFKASRSKNIDGLADAFRATFGAASGTKGAR